MLAFTVYPGGASLRTWRALMTYPSPPGPQSPGGWNDPAWSGGQPGGHPDPTLPMSGAPVSNEPAVTYPASAAPVSGYPVQPEQVSGYPVPAGQVSGYPVAAGQVSGYPPQQAAYPSPGYPSYGGYPPVAASPPTNGMAIASMVVSIVSVLGLCGYGIGGLLGIVGAILGHVAKRQIRERGESGDSMALTGIILGWIATALGVIIIIALVGFFIWAANTDPSTFETE